MIRLNDLLIKKTRLRSYNYLFKLIWSKNFEHFLN